jgi:Apoptosis regulator proteins, Bcl-2 family
MANEICKLLVVGKNTRYSKTLNRLIEETHATHEILFKSITKKLSPCDAAAIKAVVEEMFTDNIISWGRIVTVYALIYHSMAEIDRCDIADYIADKFSSWIEQQGGWIEFEKFFEMPSIDRLVLKGLGWTAVGLGIITLVTILS